MHRTPTIRPATEDDAECLSVLAIQVWLHTYAIDGIRKSIARHVTSEFTADNFRQIVIDGKSLLLVAEGEQHLVGYALVKFGSHCPTRTEYTDELATLYIQEHFARQNIGTALLESCLAQIRERNGDAKLWLTVNTLNAPAIAFYQKHGFEPAGYTQFEFGGESHENNVLVSARA